MRSLIAALLLFAVGCATPGRTPTWAAEDDLDSPEATAEAGEEERCQALYDASHVGEGIDVDKLRASLDCWEHLVDPYADRAWFVETKLAVGYATLGNWSETREAETDEEPWFVFDRSLHYVERVLIHLLPRFADDMRHGARFEEAIERVPPWTAPVLALYAEAAQGFRQKKSGVDDYYFSQMDVIDRLLNHWDAEGLYGIAERVFRGSKPMASILPNPEGAVVATAPSPPPTPKVRPPPPPPPPPPARRPPPSLPPPPPQASEGLDVRKWLARPGVRLLAVELYASWCKPCMKAVPAWKALHERYRRQGLRLVVVATQDPQAGCVNPGWNPDELVCDDEGTIARALGAGQRLPAAYLWSWQGNLLVRKGHVDEVEPAIQRWMRDTPRVLVEADPEQPGLDSMLRSRFADDDKLIVIASAEEQAALRKLQAESLKSTYDDALQCEVGKELSANSLLRARVVGRTARKRLQLSLLSVESGCLVASSVVDWNATKPKTSVAEGVSELMQQLRPAVQMPKR